MVMSSRLDFDALAKNVARGLSRREALHRLGLGLAAGLLAEFTGWLPAWQTPRADAAGSASLGACFPEVVTKGSLTSWLNFSNCLDQAGGVLSGCNPALCSPGVCCGGVLRPRSLLQQCVLPGRRELLRRAVHHHRLSGSPRQADLLQRERLYWRIALLLQRRLRRPGV
jgi:hypothetical protein